jgi:hypothetical protein
VVALRGHGEDHGELIAIEDLDLILIRDLLAVGQHRALGEIVGGSSLPERPDSFSQAGLR